MRQAKRCIRKELPARGTAGAADSTGTNSQVFGHCAR